MTELENLQSQIRESKMRLRELRTENAELKIQYRRWLLLSVGVSFLSFCLSVALAVMLNSREVGLSPQSAENKVAVGEEEVAQPKTQNSEKIVNKNSDPLTAPPLEVPDTNRFFPLGGSEVDISKSSPKPNVGKPELQAPALPVDEPNGAETSATPAPNVAQSFSLPGSSAKPQKKVKRYVVQKNDNLWKIVNKYCGSATPQRIKKVMQDNGLSDTNLRVGSTLLLIIDD